MLTDINNLKINKNSIIEDLERRRYIVIEKNGDLFAKSLFNDAGCGEYLLYQDRIYKNGFKIINNGGDIVKTCNSFGDTKDKYIPENFISILTNKLNGIHFILIGINNTEAYYKITDKHESLSVAMDDFKKSLKEFTNYVERGYKIPQSEFNYILTLVRAVLLAFRESAYVYAEIHSAPTYILKELKSYYTDITTMRDIIENK